MEYAFKAALFDLDGVVVDTEGQYTEFWAGVTGRYLPASSDLMTKVKGVTLVEILDEYFPDSKMQQIITDELNAFQDTMEYPYVPGVVEFIKALRAAGIKTAVATASDRVKMEKVYRKLPELQGFFDRIFTSEDYARSKPQPDCYITAAEYFGFSPKECIVLEDSFNGLCSAAASGAMVVGLTTTIPAEVVREKSHIAIPDFQGFTPEVANEVFTRNFCGK